MKTTIPNASPWFLQHHFSAPKMPTKLREGGRLPMPAMVRKAAKQASKTKQNKAKHEEMLAPPLHHPSSVMILIDEGCWEIHSWWPECSQSPILIRDMKNLNPNISILLHPRCWSLPTCPQTMRSTSMQQAHNDLIFFCDAGSQKVTTF